MLITRDEPEWEFPAAQREDMHSILYDQFIQTLLRFMQKLDLGCIAHSHAFFAPTVCLFVGLIRRYGRAKRGAEGEGRRGGEGGCTGRRDAAGNGRARPEVERSRGRHHLRRFRSLLRGAETLRHSLLI